MDWGSPAPELPAPLSKSISTRGVFWVKSLRAVVRFLSLVKRMAGSGAWLVVPAAKLVKSSRTRAARPLGAVGTLSAT